MSELNLDENNFGCEQGTIQTTFEYAVKADVYKSSDYPWVGKEQECKAK